MKEGAFSRFACQVEPIELPDGICSERVSVIQDRANPFFYWSNTRGVLVCPPHGMHTDFGSIPKSIQRIPHLDRMTFAPSYILHDCLYWFRYALKPRICVELEPDDSGMIHLTGAKWACLLEGIFEPNDNIRMALYMDEFHIVPVTRLWCDVLLNEMMYVQTHGDAAWERPVVQTGLFLGGWVPWWLHARRKAGGDDPPPLDHEICTA